MEKLGAADGYLFGDANDDYPTGQGTGPYASYVGESGTIAGSVGGDDNRDVFLIAREDGFPERSWLGATLAGEMGCCTVRVVQLNTSLYSPWPVMAQNETLLSGQQASVGMDLPHGYHLLVVESNGSETVVTIIEKGYATITDSNTPYTTVAGAQILANTTSAVITVTLPAAASTGDEVTIIDARGTWGSNNLTVGRNGLPINTGTSDLTLSNNGQSITLVYVDATRGWAYKTNYTS